MKQVVLGLALVVGVSSVAASQDMTTLLSQFLNGLYGGYIRMVSGTATNPAYAFSTETNTGFFRSASNTIGVSVAGTEQFQFSGNQFRVNGGVKLGSAGSDILLSAASANVMTWSGVAFASLGTPANGSFAYCTDCTVAATCAGLGTGALAKRLAGVWVCN